MPQQRRHLELPPDQVQIENMCTLRILPISAGHCFASAFSLLSLFPTTHVCRLDGAVWGLKASQKDQEEKDERAPPGLVKMGGEALPVLPVLGENAKEAIEFNALFAAQQAGDSGYSPFIEVNNRRDILGDDGHNIWSTTTVVV